MSTVVLVIGIALAIFVFVLFFIYIMLYVAAPSENGEVNFQEWQKQHEEEAKRSRIAFYRYGLVGYFLWAYKEARKRKSKPKHPTLLSYHEWKQMHHNEESWRNRTAAARYGPLGYLLWCYKEAKKAKDDTGTK